MVARRDCSSSAALVLENMLRRPLVDDLTFSIQSRYGVNTPFAAQTAAEKAALEALNTGMKNVEILVKGQGSGRETAIRAIEGAGLEITSIQDITSVPHNGCRPPKRRRV